jgi:hypothetical protein
MFVILSTAVGTGHKTSVVMEAYCKYSKIPFIRLAWDWTLAKLLNIVDYQMVPGLTYVLTGIGGLLNLSLRSACFIEEASFLVKSKTSCLGTTLAKCWIIRISELSDVRFKEF